MRTSSLAVLLIVGTCLFAGSTSYSQSPTSDDTLTMALTGDSIITRKLSVYEESEFLEMIKLIRTADVAFTNIEMLFHDYESYPMNQSGGTYMRAEPELAKDVADKLYQRNIPISKPIILTNIVYLRC